MSNIVLERIHQVLGNLVRIYSINKIYVDKRQPMIGNLYGDSVLNSIDSKKVKRLYSGPIDIWSWYNSPNE